MVPKGWSQKLISDVGAVVTGNTPPTSNPEYYNGKYPFVSPADLGAHKLINSSIKSLSSQGMEKARSVRAGATLFTCIGSTIGKIGLAGCTLATNQQINVVIPKPDYDDDYVYYQLELRAAYIAKLAGTQAVPIINKTTFESQCILVPDSLPEQNKIAKILSTWDKAISTTEQLLANSQQQKKSLMQQLLTGKKRLLDNNEVRFVGEWKYVVLGCVFEKISNGVTYDAKSLSGLPVTRIETISTGEIDFKKVGWAPDSENTKRFKLEIGDILYSHINSLEHIGRVAYFNDNRSLYHGMNLLLLRTKKQNNSLFFYHLLNSQVGKKYAKLYAKSAVNQASISTTDIKAFKVYIPESEEQQKIATVLSTADQEIASLQQKLDALKLEKKALMQQLLTGKRRVKIDLMVL